MWSKMVRALPVLMLIGMVVMPLSVAADDIAVTETQVMARATLSGESAGLGETVTVEVWVEDVADLYGADVRLTFDNSRFVVLDADPSTPGVQIEPRADLLSPDFVVRQRADNKAGTIWYAVTQLNPREAASGSGPLFSFKVLALSGGEGTFAIQKQQLATRNADLIPAITKDVQIVIIDSANQPQVSPAIWLPILVIQR